MPLSDGDIRCGNQGRVDGVKRLNFDFLTGDFDTERWNYVSPDAYQAEVVWLLQWEEEKRGPRTRVEAVAEKASSACAVS